MHLWIRVSAWLEWDVGCVELGRVCVIIVEDCWLRHWDRAPLARHSATSHLHVRIACLMFFTFQTTLEMCMGMEFSMGMGIPCDSHENGNENPISMGMWMGMISVGVGMLENALWKKFPFDIKFKAKWRIITAQMNALINSVFVTNENNGCWITYWFNFRNVTVICSILCLLVSYNETKCRGGNVNVREWEWVIGSNTGMVFQICKFRGWEWEGPCRYGRDWEYWISNWQYCEFLLLLSSRCQGFVSKHSTTGSRQVRSGHQVISHWVGLGHWVKSHRVGSE